MSQIKPWKTLQSEVVLDNDYLKVRKEVCQLPDGMILQDYYVTDSPDAAVIFGVTREDQVVLVRQYRHAAEQMTLELPAGLQSRHDINIAEAARRELMEETGYAADKLQKVAEFYMNPTRTAAKIHLYYASDMEKVSQPLNSGKEITEIEIVSKSELETMIADSRINSLTQVMCVQYMLNYLKNERTQ